MTQREFLNNIINGNINSDTIEIAKAEVAKLDARNDKRRNTLTKEQKANEEVKDAIVEFLNGKGAVVASEIASGMGLSTQKVSALAKQLVEADRVTVSEVKVKGKGTVKAYAVKA